MPIFSPWGVIRGLRGAPFAPDALAQETSDGDRFLLEDDSGYILLETA